MTSTQSTNHNANNATILSNVLHSPLSFFHISTLCLITFFINLLSLAVPIMTLQVYDRILAYNSIATLKMLCFGVGVIIILDVALRIIRARAINWASAEFEHQAYSKAIRHIMKADLEQIKIYTPGEKLHKLSSIVKMKSFYSGQTLINLVDLPFMIIFIAFIGWVAGPLIWVPLTLMTAFILFSIKIGIDLKVALRKRDRYDDRRINTMLETLENIHTVKALGLETAQQRRYEALQLPGVIANHAVANKNAIALNAGNFFTQVMMISMISVGALMVTQGTLTMGILIACVLLSGRIMQPLQRALSFWITFQEYRIGHKKLDALFSIPITTQKKPILNGRKGILELKDLHFTYPGRDKAVINGINLKLMPGDIIALQGAPGSGKNSLLKLMTGLYKPTHGHVLIDGEDAHTYPPDKLAHHIGYLSERAVIFQGTILENLTSFRPEYIETAYEISKLLGIDQIVTKLSQGYQTMLMDGPADPVTPGLKQRIALGRVLINKPRILLFESADKSLDKDGYNHIFRLLGQLRNKISLIIVSSDRNLLHLAREEYKLIDGKLIPVDYSTDSKQHTVRPYQELNA